MSPGCIVLVGDRSSFTTARVLEVGEKVTVVDYDGRRRVVARSRLRLAEPQARYLRSWELARPEVTE